MLDKHNSVYKNHLIDEDMKFKEMFQGCISEFYLIDPLGKIVSKLPRVTVLLTLFNFLKYVLTYIK